MQASLALRFMRLAFCRFNFIRLCCDFMSENIEYQLILSDRRSISVEVDRNLNVIVRAPKKMKKSEIEKFVLKHEVWLEKAIEKQKNRASKRPELNETEIKALKLKAKEVIPSKVRYYSEIMQLKPTGIKITSAKTRLGSCSGKNSLCFSYLLMQYSEDVIDYVVVHELAHIKYHNHGKAFYKLIEQYLPDYKDSVKNIKN